MNLKIGEFIIMPNHMHAILIIGNNRFNKRRSQNEKCSLSMHAEATGNDLHIETKQDISITKEIINLNRKENFGQPATSKKTFGPQRKNLGSIIRGYKSAVTKYAKQKNIEFEWQRNYFDTIIRTKAEYLAVEKYIKYNPQNWPNDEYALI